MIISSKQKISLFISVVLVAIVVWASISVKISEEDLTTEYLNNSSTANIITTTVPTTETTTQTTTTTTTEITTQSTTEKVTETTTSKPTTTTTTKQTTTTEKETESSDKIYSASYFKKMGVIYWGDWRWTWYSERVLPGNGLRIPGRHNDDNGYVCDENNFICLASSVLKRGTVIDTPFGKQGKVYDSGCASDTVDVYVSW